MMDQKVISARSAALRAVDVAAKAYLADMEECSLSPNEAFSRAVGVDLSVLAKFTPLPPFKRMTIGDVHEFLRGTVGPDLTLNWARPEHLAHAFPGYRDWTGPDNICLPLVDKKGDLFTPYARCPNITPQNLRQVSDPTLAPLLTPLLEGPSYAVIDIAQSRHPITRELCSPDSMCRPVTPRVDESEFYRQTDDIDFLTGERLPVAYTLPACLLLASPFGFSNTTDSRGQLVVAPISERRYLETLEQALPRSKRTFIARFRARVAYLKTRRAQRSETPKAKASRAYRARAALRGS